MAAPKFSPVAPELRTKYYRSPEFVPAPWMPDRPGVVEGFQPVAPGLGSQGPDQGFALRIAAQLAPKLKLQPGEHVDDAIRGCLGVALRRASMFSRAPVVHDLEIAFTMFGFYDDQPPHELLALRDEMFEGLRHVGHHYAEARAVADLPPESTLRGTVDQVRSRYPAEWRELLGLD